MDVLVMLNIKSVRMDVLVRLNIKGVGMDVLVRLNIKRVGYRKPLYSETTSRSRKLSARGMDVLVRLIRRVCLEWIFL